MEGLTLSTKEQHRLQILNGVLQRYWTIKEAALLLGVSERQGWRLLAAYRREGARGLAHKNRGRLPPNATPEAIQQQVVALARERYQGINHTQRTELLAEREGLRLSLATVRRLLVRAGLSSPRQRRPPNHRCPRPRMPQEGMLLQLDGSHHAWLEGRGSWLTLLRQWTMLLGRCLMPCPRNRRTPEATCLCSRASSNVGVCPWQCTPMATPSFSPGVLVQRGLEIAGLLNGVELWKNWA